MEKIRCAWCTSHPLYIDYHDNEWGVPLYDDHALFELLVLESMQAGLSWWTVLQKRAALRTAFQQFAATRIARYNERHITRLLANPAIIRNRLKIVATIKNARAFLTLQEKYGSFADYVWQFVDGRPRRNIWRHAADVPVTTAQSDRMAKALKQAGFSFLGSTTCYAYMQASGMVNDHLVNCFRFNKGK